MVRLRILRATLCGVLLTVGFGARDDLWSETDDSWTEVEARNLVESPPPPTAFPWTKKCVAGRSNVFVDGTNGKDDGTHNGSWAQPFLTINYAVKKRESCWTINVKEGTYRNENYGESKTNSKAVVTMHGVSDLIIRPWKSQKVLIQFDGPGGFVGGSSSKPVTDVEIYGFEIQGPNKDITYAAASADRLTGSKYYSGRGVAIWSGHRIHIHDMKVHDCPAAGLRVDNADYVVIEDSEVYRNTWWANSAESAVVLAQSVNIDNEDKIKMILRNNLVYDNINKVPYYNKKYTWDKSPIGSTDCSKETTCEQGLSTCPWTCRYGKATQDYVIDGQGVYVTRNKDTYLAGQMELSGNVAYGNGINGLVFHRTDRGVVRNNTLYDNGRVPKDGHKEESEEDWMAALKKTRQPYSGLTLNNAAGVKLWGNKVQARYADDYAYTMEIDKGDSYTLKAGGNNKLCRGEVDDNLKDYVATGSTADCTFG